MDRYTFVMEFRGGTYISQVEAGSLTLAIEKWSNSIDTKQIKHLGSIGKSMLIKELESEDPSPLQGLDDVWCLAASIKSGFVLINIVKCTCSDSFGRNPDSVRS